MPRVDNLQAGLVVVDAAGHVSESVGLDDALLGSNRMFCSATVAFEILSNLPFGVHLVSALVVRRDLVVDILRKAACGLFESLSNGNLGICSAVGMCLVPVQDVARAADQPAGSFRNLAMDSVFELASESTELRLECPNRPLDLAVEL